MCFKTKQHNNKPCKDKKKEIERAVAFTYGAVITKEKNVIAAPFFTSSQGSLLGEEAGEGDGCSLNYA